METVAVILTGGRSSRMGRDKCALRLGGETFLERLVERYRGSLIPSRAFADGGIHEAIEQYEDTIFYELLAEELALRDLDGQPLTRENYDALMARIDAYLSEFDEHGTDRVTVDLDEG